MTKSLPNPPRQARIKREFYTGRALVVALGVMFGFVLISIAAPQIVRAQRFAQKGVRVDARILTDETNPQNKSHLIHYQFGVGAKSYERTLELSEAEYGDHLNHGGITITYDSSDPERQALGEQGQAEANIIIGKWILGFLLTGLVGTWLWISTAQRAARQVEVLKNWPEAVAEIDKVSASAVESVAEYTINASFVHDGHQSPVTLRLPGNSKIDVHEGIAILYNPEDPSEVVRLDDLNWAEVYHESHRTVIHHGM